MGDTDRGLLPLLEGLTSVVQAAGAAFAPYAGGVVERALHIAQMHMTQVREMASGLFWQDSVV